MTRRPRAREEHRDLPAAGTRHTAETTAVNRVRVNAAEEYNKSTTMLRVHLIRIIQKADGRKVSEMSFKLMENVFLLKIISSELFSLV